MNARTPTHDASARYWTQVPAPMSGAGVYRMTRRGWMHAIVAVSSLDAIDDGRGGKLNGPTWHLSVSRASFIFGGSRPTDEDVSTALSAFGMVGAEEDNHANPFTRAGGLARHFWLHTDPARRVGCECKSTEETVVDPDGYTYTRPRTA